MAKTAGRDMVVANFDDELRPQRRPLAGALGAPSARTPRRTAREAGRRNEPLELFGQRRPVEIVQGRGKADVVEPALIIIKTEQQGADEAEPTRREFRS